MNWVDIVSISLLFAGVFFFIAGTVGLLRFPDVYARLHALTKVDNLGLGLLVLGLIFKTESVSVALKLLLIWALMLGAGATAAYLVANSARRQSHDAIDGAIGGAIDGASDPDRTPT
jgi:multicomponent Na+:H+ antiporter subunit G